MWTLLTPTRHQTGLVFRTRAEARKAAASREHGPFLSVARMGEGIQG